ncbi:DUF3489 domain-containing protein [Nitrosomonas communis]|uniref:DUF3489 domain-containing protein n=1 Tax=Nitrosomonas communis TaxID=44574 RepID=A0A1I4LPV3_9PROT|nr:DUF3489 domain-containing protein [Nitrosomonas communis]SFL92866.1 Protein of unknown function [Nitrosomonas communis]
MTIKLSPAQQQIISHAAAHTDGKLIWFPDNLKGGARSKVIESMFNRGLITIDKTDWFVSEQGYQALGLPRRASFTPAASDSVKETKATQPHKPRSRDNSKRAQMIAMLKRPEGTTIDQLCEMTGWQAHTVRGALAGTLKKKLGLTITSEKAEASERVYRIT